MRYDANVTGVIGKRREALLFHRVLVRLLFAPDFRFQMKLAGLRLAFAVTNALRLVVGEFEFKLLVAAPVEVLLRRLMHGSSLNVLGMTRRLPLGKIYGAGA
jgi:hypothetical protein